VIKKRNEKEVDRRRMLKIGWNRDGKVRVDR
jgi:hypothetical protein